MSTSSSPTPDPKEAVRQDWLGAAPAWKKWYSQLAFQSRQATDLVVKGAALSPGMHVLDLAAGSGEPALSVSAAVGPEGRVTATDLLREMLEIAEENASARGIKNIDFRAADAEQLPFRHHVRSQHSESPRRNAPRPQAQRPRLLRHLGLHGRESTLQHDDQALPEIRGCPPSTPRRAA